MTFKYYQKIGIYPLNQTHPRIIPAITEISRAAGAPGVAMSTYQAKGVGLHRTGEAVDFQAGNAQKYGSRYRDATAIHNEIAKYVLANWKRLKVRYMAWNGYEYGGSWGGPERKRKQATNYGGSDPWHQHHVHVDFKPGAIKANPGIAVGSALKTAPKPSKYYYTGDITGSPNTQTYLAMQRFLADRRYYDRQLDGQPGLYTWLGFQKFLKKLGYFTPEPSGVQDLTTARALQAWLTNAGHYNGPVGVAWTKDTWKAWQTYLRWAHKGTPVTPKASPKPTKPTPKPEPEKEFLMALSDFEQKKLAEDVNKTKMAMGRSEDRERAMLEYLAVIAEAVSDPELSKSLRERVEQTNAAVGRIEKAYQDAIAAEKEGTNE